MNHLTDTTRRVKRPEIDRARGKTPENFLKYSHIADCNCEQEIKDEINCNCVKGLDDIQFGDLEACSSSERAENETLEQVDVSNQKRAKVASFEILCFAFRCLRQSVSESSCNSILSLLVSM